jgi:hypothetical protein
VLFTCEELCMHLQAHRLSARHENTRCLQCTLTNPARFHPPPAYCSRSAWPKYLHADEGVRIQAGFGGPGGRLAKEQNFAAHVVQVVQAAALHDFQGLAASLDVE